MIRSLVRKGAAFAAAVLFAGSLGCSAVSGRMRGISDDYIKALLARDIARADSLSAGGDSHLGDYAGWEYKNTAVDAILDVTHYRFSEDLSGDDEEGILTAVYILVMPNVNAVLAKNPASFDEFVSLLGTCGKTEVTIPVKFVKEDGIWCVSNSEEIAANFYGSLYSPVYAFILDGSLVFENGKWSSAREDGSYENTTGISCHYDFTDAYLDSGLGDLEITYEYYKNDTLIYEGEAVMDEDMTGVSFPLDVENTSLSFDYLPQFNYTLAIYSSGALFYSDEHECTLSSAVFPDGTAVDTVAWQHTDSSGRYFNVSTIDAKVWINSKYLESGRPLSITYDVFCEGEALLLGESAAVSGSVAVCEFSMDDLSLIETGNYSINIYNNGTYTGGATANVILNLDPSDYTQVDTPETVEDLGGENAELEIFTGSRSAIDTIDEYTDVDFDYTSVSMNIFEDRINATLASGEDAPDIIICDSSYASLLARSDMTKPLNSIGISYGELQYMYEYTFALTTDTDAVIKGVTWEITPGAVYYRRSVASSVLGVSEPYEVQPYFESWEAFLNTASYVNEQTDGRTRILSNTSDIEDAYINGKTQSWFNDSGNITVPEYMEDYLGIIKTLTDNELTFDDSRWSSAWSSRISNRTTLSYFGNIRFGEIFLKTSGSGDWGIVMPPVNYFDGGNFLFVTSYCDMDYSARQFIRDVAINSDHLEDMAEDQYTVNNISIMLTCADDSDYEQSWLGGQNPFKIFSQVAWNIDASTVSPYDEIIADEFIDAANSYVSGTYGDTEEALDAFREAAQEAIDERA